jgi:hypothetical protein
LTRRGFEAQRRVAKLPRLNLQGRQKLSSDASPSPCWLHEHSLDFTDARFEFTNRSATNRFTIGVCDKEREPAISDVFGTKTVQRDARISSTQVVIERAHKANGIS